MIFYEMICILYTFLYVIIGIIYKSISADIFFINVVSSFIIFSSFFLKGYFSSKYIGTTSNEYKDSDKDSDKDLNRIKINNIGDHSKLINKLISKDAIIIGASGCLYFIFSLMALKNLPLSIFIPLSSSWVFFSLIFEKILLNIDIAIENIVVFILLFAGIVTLTYTKNTKTSDTKYIYVGILLVSVIVRAFHVTYVKKQSIKYDEEELIAMDYFINTILGIIIFFGYIYTQKKYNLPDKKTILIILGVVLLLDNLKNYFKFVSIKNISENSYILITNTSLIFSMILGYYIYNEKITMQKMIGTSILLSSIIAYIFINKDKSGEIDINDKESNEKLL